MSVGETADWHYSRATHGATTDHFEFFSSTPLALSVPKIMGKPTCMMLNALSLAFFLVDADETDSAGEWAKFFGKMVLFDIAGFSTLLYSDRGAAFTSAVVEAINAMLGITHAFGAIFHSESQGYLEARHKTVNNVLAAYATAHPEN